MDPNGALAIPYVEKIVRDMLSGSITESEGILALRVYASERFRTFRDDMAGRAMQGMLAGEPLLNVSDIVERAYRIADLMSARRERE